MVRYDEEMQDYWTVKAEMGENRSTEPSASARNRTPTSRDLTNKKYVGGQSVSGHVLSRVSKWLVSLIMWEITLRSG